MLSTFLSVARRALAAGGIVLAGLLLGPSVAVAQVPTAAGDSYVRLAHLSPDTPTVDVYVGSVNDPATSFVVPGVSYGAFSNYRPLPAGSYVVSMRAAGAPADSPAVISASVDAQPGGAYTIAGVGLSAELGLQVLTDKVDIPAAGKASVRVINGAPSAPSVDVGPQGGPSWAGAVRFATDTTYREVPLGTWNLQVSSAGRPTVSLPCQLEANSSYTVLLVDKSGTLEAEVIRDSTGTGLVPVGGVQTGFGGLALDPGWMLGGALLAAAGGGLLATRIGSGRARAR